MRSNDPMNSGVNGNIYYLTGLGLMSVGVINKRLFSQGWAHWDYLRLGPVLKMRSHAVLIPSGLRSLSSSRSAWLVTLGRDLLEVVTVLESSLLCMVTVGWQREMRLEY